MIIFVRSAGMSTLLRLLRWQVGFDWQKDVHASTLLSHMYRGNDCRRKCQSEQLADVL